MEKQEDRRASVGSSVSSSGAQRSDSKRKSKSTTLSSAVPADTEAVAALRPLWEQAGRDLPVHVGGKNDDKIVELLEKLTNSLEDAEDPSEASFLLARPLPEAVALVLDAKFLTDHLHKRSTGFMQAALNFCLGAVALEPRKFSNDAFLLMSQIFRHKHFQEVMSITAPPSSAGQTSAAVSSTAGAAPAGTRQPGISFADVAKTAALAPAPSAPTGRSSLTASRTAKTLNRLTEAVTLFTRQDGYKIIVSTLENAEVSDILAIYYIMDAVIAMNQFIGINFLRQQLSPVLKAVYGKLLKFVPFASAAVREKFVEIRDMVLREATQHVQGDPTLVSMTQQFVVDYTTLMLKGVPRQVSVLYVTSSARSKLSFQIDIKKMVSVKEFKQAIAEKIAATSSAKISSAQFVIATIRDGLIVRVHADNAHIFALLLDSNESIVAYEIPAVNKKSNSGSIPVLIQVSQTRPLDRHYVPFFLSASPERPVTPQWLFENVAGAYTFRSTKSTDQPFKLRFSSAQEQGNGAELVFNSTKPIQVSAGSQANLHQLIATGHVYVEWGDGVQFEELQGYDKESFYAAESMQKFTTDEFLRFGISGRESLASFLCNVPSVTADSFKSVQKFVSALSDLVLTAVDQVTLRLAAKVFAGLAQAGNHLMKQTILQPLLPALTARFTVLLESPDSELRAAVAQAICELSTIRATNSGTAGPILDFFPFPRASGVADEREDSGRTFNSSKASNPLHTGLQFLVKLNFYRTVDLSYFATADPKAELYWYLPLILKMIKMEPSNTPKSSVAALMRTLQKRQYLAQLAMWLRITRFVEDDDFPGGIDWASSQRFANTRAFFNRFITNMPEKGASWNNLDILDPIFENEDGSCKIITGVIVKKIFSSKAKPCLLEVTYQESSSKTPSTLDDFTASNAATSSTSSKKKRRDREIKKAQALSEAAAAQPKTGLFIFKKGDDLRVDMLVQTMFFMFNTIWANAGLKHVPFTHQYKIIPMGADIGAVEFVQGSESIQTFDWNSWQKLSSQQRDIFMRSAAGGYVAGWVLGIRDRHQDNMMVKDGHIFYQIDFGHMFNEKPTIDAPRFAIPSDMKTVMTNDEWELFKDICADAFRALHRMSNIVISLCLSVYEGVEEVDIAKVRKFLTSDQGLMVAMSEAEACLRIKNLVESGVSSLWRMNKWGIHTVFAAGGAKAPVASPPPEKKV